MSEKKREEIATTMMMVSRLIACINATCMCLCYNMCRCMCVCMVERNEGSLKWFNFAESNKTFEHITFVFKTISMHVSFYTKLIWLRIQYFQWEGFFLCHALAIMPNTKSFGLFFFLSSFLLRWLSVWFFESTAMII